MSAAKDPEYLVVVNDEEQFSIWPARMDIPNGWKSAGKSGSKDDCLSYVKEVWTDMRPKSLREALARDAAHSSAAQRDRQ